MDICHCLRHILLGFPKAVTKNVTFSWKCLPFQILRQFLFHSYPLSRPFYNNFIHYFRQRWRIWWLLLESRARCGTGSSKCPCSNLLWYSFGQSGEALGGAWLLQSFCSVLLTKSNTHIQPKKQGKKKYFESYIGKPIVPTYCEKKLI